ncbi:transferase [Astrocystis sublimbata]|nr:transferase [Astrocystis sublimbata]
MQEYEVFDIQPSISQVAELEWFRLSPLDLIVTQHYNSYAVIFEAINPLDRESIVKIVCQALEATLLQCRHLVGTIEPNDQGDFSILKRPSSSVPLVVRTLDSSDDRFPLIDSLRQSHFCCGDFGDATILSNPGMTMSSEASPLASMPVVGFQLNFIPGGMILTVNIHHFAMDLTGTCSLIKHLGAHCYSLRHGIPGPSWDARLLNRSRFIPRAIPEEAKINAQPAPMKNPHWLPCTWLLFHIPQDRLMKLKQLATPTDGSWISTYDALVAFLWRILSKTRATIYKPDCSSPAILLESVNMRKRLQPPVPTEYQGNVLCGGLSFTQKDQLTLDEVISTAPISRLATFIRNITNSVTEDTLQTTLDAVAPLRDKSNLHVQLESFPPMSLAVTDWRDASVRSADFGFGRPVAFRQLADKVVSNMLIIYPQESTEQGLEVVLPFEKHALDVLHHDQDLEKFFVFKGVEASCGQICNSS